jgi:hypothetical protein
VTDHGYYNTECSACYLLPESFKQSSQCANVAQQTLQLSRLLPRSTSYQLPNPLNHQRPNPHTTEHTPWPPLEMPVTQSARTSLASQGWDCNAR